MVKFSEEQHFKTETCPQKKTVRTRGKKGKDLSRLTAKMWNGDLWNTPSIWLLSRLPSNAVDAWQNHLAILSQQHPTLLWDQSKCIRFLQKTSWFIHHVENV